MNESILAKNWIHRLGNKNEHLHHQSKTEWDGYVREAWKYRTNES